MQNCKPIDIYGEKGKALGLKMYPNIPNEKDKLIHVPYVSIIGNLMYIMMCTHLDICYIIGLVIKFQLDPDLTYLKAIKLILRDLKGTINYILCYQGSNLYLIGYNDANRRSNLGECKLTGNVFLLSDVVISQSNKKQLYIAFLLQS